MIASKAQLIIANAKNFGYLFPTYERHQSFQSATYISSFTKQFTAPFKLIAVFIGMMLATLHYAHAQESEGKIITRSELGAWHLRYDESTPGLNCGIRFIPGKRNVDTIAIFGPTSKAAYATLLFSGAQIPVTRSPKEIDLTLWMKGLPESNLKGIILPKQADTSTNNLMIAAGDIRKLLQSMRDSEENLGLLIKREVIRETIVELNYDGLDKARTAMLDCIAGRPINGQSMDAALAEIRPLGKSTISGRAYFKGALLAAKQYPPKGSGAVGLIWMSEEFKTWFEEVKASKKVPDHIPERIAKHFMSTKILDNEGGFSFKRLPAGEYTLIANFSYSKEINVPEVVGQTHTFNAAGVHLGTQDKVVNWSYIIKQPTTFQKQVTIKNDGETLDVSLDKSQIICFLVCF